MDYLRSCYTVDMVFRDGDDPVKVQWYFTDDAKAFPAWHAFGSANWMSKEVVSGDLGEQPGPRAWVNGNPPINAGVGDQKAIACAETREEWFRTGLPIDEDGGPWDANGLPLCCTEELPCCDCDIPDSFLGTVTSTIFCDCASALTLSFNRVEGGVCRWESQAIDCAGFELVIALEFTQGAECDGQCVLMCDGVEFGREAAGGDLCDTRSGTCILMPSINDCCLFVQFDWSWE
jgi:hypothetical protein